MPKKFTGENTKAVAAKSRKEAAKADVKSKKLCKEEEAKWGDSDKTATKKLRRKEDQDRKRQDQLKKKASNKELLEKELASLSVVQKEGVKVTRSQIEKNAKPKPERERKVETHLDKIVEENANRVETDGEAARNINEAINLLSSKEPNVDKHPEKRLKAAYTVYEERRLIQLKKEHPTLKLSQMKQLIFKDWQKAPENPRNKTT